MSTTYNSYYKPEVNLIHENTQILKTVLLLERKYAAPYIARILMGDSRFDLRKVTHKELETYGALDHLSSFRIEDLVYYLVEQDLLEVDDPQYGTIVISKEGSAWLDDPQDMIVNRKDVYTGWWGFELRMAVRSIRKEAAENLGKRPYELFSNYAIAQMTRELPQTEEELDTIPSMRDLDQAVKLLILTAINQVAEKKNEDANSGIYSKAHSPSHRKVKDLYESGFSLEEIAERRKLQTRTVREYLFTLQKAGMLDLKPWIEQHLDPKILYKGAEYFRTVEDRRLKAAHEVLGMDYDTLALCRDYVDRAGEPGLQYAS